MDKLVINKLKNKIVTVNGGLLVPKGTKEKLPANTLLIEIEDSDSAREKIESTYNTGTYSYEKVDNTHYKITNSSTDWSDMMKYCGNYLLKVLEVGDTSSVTNMEAMFYRCCSLTSVPLFNTSNVTNMSLMFESTSITSVPLFDTSNVTTMERMFLESDLTSVPLFNTSKVEHISYMFYKCINVESGALALYEQASSTGKVTSYENCFTNCGSDTETGRAELAQIPTSWGGTKAE